MKRVLSLALSLIALLSSLLALSSCFGDEVELIDINLTSESYAVAVKKGNTQLLNTVNSVINDAKKDGTLDKILNKYFSGNEKTYRKVSSGTEDPLKLKKQLIVATHTQFHPFEFSKYESGKGKQYSGIDIEIAAMVADKLGYELVIKEIDFNKLFSAVNNGEADLAIAGISVNEERQREVDFSVSYYTSSQVIIVKDGDKTFKNCETRADVEKILNELDGNTTVGAQSDTTGLRYASSYNVSVKGYASAILATQALINGDVSFVIVDKEHAKQIVESING